MDREFVSESTKEKGGLQVVTSVEGNIHFIAFDSIVNILRDISTPPDWATEKPRETAPDWIKCNLSIKRADLAAWLAEQKGDWINVQVCESKSGDKWYAEVDTWEPKKMQNS